MTYSFIRPKPKSIFKRYTKIWFFYTVLAVVCIYAFAQALEKQSIEKINEKAQIEETIQHTKLKAIVVKDYIERLDYEVNLGEKIQIQNKMLKDGLSNLLNLIPDQITTKSIELVFTQTKVEFYPLMSGWFNFVSVSKANPSLKPLKPTSQGAQ